MLARWVKSLVYNSPAARFIAPRYHYNFRPAHLAYMVACLDEIKEVKGSVVEAGCFAGATTIFLREHLRDIGQRRYIAVDTFGGFVPSDVDYEMNQRGKAAQRSTLVGGFSQNRREWVERSMALAGHGDVEVVQADVATLDYAAYAPIAFALIDVDLYLPVQKALSLIAPHMAEGGRIIVDDCSPRQVFDGALQAYDEWCLQQGIPREIVHQKLGVLRF